MTREPPCSRTGRITAAFGAAALLHLVLIQPNHPAAMTWGALAVFPLELPAILLALVALPRGSRATLAVRAALVGALTVIAALKLADFMSFTALSRGFNPVADAALVSAAFRLTAGSLGLLAAVAATAGLLLAIAALATALWWATGVWARLSLPRLPALAAGAAAFAAASVATAEIGDAMGRWRLPVEPPGAAFTARVGVERIVMARETLADLRAFAAAAREDPYAEAAPLFDRLDRDLLVIFVESYGRASLDTPLYAPRTRATLNAAERALAEQGLAMRSGWLSAPTRGGQSWLSHATLATGLRIDGQTRYSAVLASGRRTLYDLAARSGRHAAAVMPAITLEWPEGIVLGFETILAADDLGYAGLPFNWVTMPDQYTLSALDRLLRDNDADPAADRPLVAQVALVSSHAPWVPVPELVPWDEVGDGRIFDAMAQAGDPPDVVWRDRDRVRAQYGEAVDYALRTVFDWAARQGDAPPLLLVLGDHQAAPFVALDDRPDVPAHLIGPPDLVAAAAAWGWGEGLVPAPDGTVDGMEVMRDRLLATWSSGGPGATRSAAVGEAAR
ncbi:LTA synthase family protein [Rhodovulum sp. 12E13]|uniref:LTA synthase family protein n=1 Tax=Rhodovulum sp. 12E13 TaxID=2203891 RepID=UPI001F2C7B73|nr:LTA synthase family protein [Rhodovulum sp. 12E13]